MRKTVFVLLFAASCLAVNAADSACTVKDFRGVYIFHAQATNVAFNTPVTFAGTLTADGNGKITAWKDWGTGPAPVLAPPNFKVVTPLLDRHKEATGLGGEITYKVEPDCRIKVTAMVLQWPTQNPTPIVWLGGLAADGDEALLMNGSEQSPFLSLVTLKRASRKNGKEPSLSPWHDSMGR